MSLRFFSGFDDRLTADKWTQASGSHVPSGGPDGRDCWNVAPPNNVALRKDLAVPIAMGSTVFAGCRFKRSGSTQDQGVGGMPRLEESGTAHLEVWLRMNNRAIELRRGSTTIAISAPDVIANETWHYLAIEANIHDTTGVAKVYVDGRLVIDFAGDTRNGNTGIVTGVGWGTNSGFTTYVMDCYIADTAAGVVTTLRKDVKVKTAYPDGNGAVQQWTASGGGSHALDVDEDPPDGVAYVFESVVGEVELFTFGDVAGSGENVLGLQTGIRAQKTDAGILQYRHKVRVSGVNYDLGGDWAPPNGSLLGTFVIWEQNPAIAGAWTPTTANAAEAGAEVRT